MNYNRKICILAVMLVLTTSGCAFGNASDESYVDFTQQSEITEKIRANRDTLSKAQTAIDNKDYNSAINFLNGYINSKQSKYEAYKLRGDAYYALRRYNFAQNDYQKAIELKTSDDKLSTGTKYVGAVLLGADKNEQLQNTELGNLYGALMYAKKAQNDPTYQQAYDNAVKYNSHIYLPAPNKIDINRINCPQKYYKPLNPTGMDEKMYSSITDIENNDFHAAIFKIQDVISTYPNYYLGYYLMGVALNGLEQEDEAIKSFEKAISLNPYDFESYASLGQIFYDKSETDFLKEDRDKSNLYFKKARKLNPNCPTYNFYLGLNNLNEGQISNAISNFNNAINLNENDYNSRYYKLIAQYINGEYSNVISEATKLIYKNVSNINSVLYLRALAYYKSGESEKALADLNTIDNNVKDIFNSDIKTTSKRDNTLESYSNYLRSIIDNSQGRAGLSADGFTNPIINKLAHVQKSLKPYEEIINSKNITSEDYKKLENFYATSLPKMLENGIYVTYDDIDSQYDFIRTTFSDLGISFIKKSNDSYVITTIDSYPYKRYSKKLEQENLSEFSDDEQQSLENMDLKSYSDVDISTVGTSTQKLLQPGESSLAQMLATNVLVKRATENINSGAQVQPKLPEQEYSGGIANANFRPQQPDGETVNSASITTSQEPYFRTNKQLVNENNMQKVKELINEEQNIQATKSNANSPINYTKQDETAKDFAILNEPLWEQNQPLTNEETDKNNVKISYQKDYNKPETRNQTVQETRQSLENSNYTKSVYKGVTTAPKMPQIDDWSDVVELDLTPQYAYSGTSLFSDNRSNYSPMPSSTENIYENRQINFDNNIDYSQISNSYVEENEKPVNIVKPEFYNLNSNNTTAIQYGITDATAPQLRMEEGSPQLRVASSNFEQPVKRLEKVKEEKTVSYEDIAQNNTHTQDGYTLLDEYEKLAKIQKKQEKQKAKEEKKLQKLELKAQKQKLKAEQKLAATEQKAKLKLEKAKIKEEIIAAKSERQITDKTQPQTDKPSLISKIKNKSAKATQLDKQAAKEAKVQEKAEKKLANAKLKAERAAAKQTYKDSKQIASEEKQSFISKLKNKFAKNDSSEKLDIKELKAQEKAQKKLEDSAIKAQQREQKQKEKLEANEAKKQQKLAQEQEKAIEKAKEIQTKKTDIQAVKKQQEQLKNERVQAKAEKNAEKLKLKAQKAEQKAAQKEQNAAIKAQKTAQKEQKKSEKNVNLKTEKTCENSFISKLKFWEKKTQKKPELRL